MLFGFTKKQRLLSSSDYSQVFNKPAFRISNRHLLLLAMPTELPCSRLGLVISKKNVGCAVKRNRIKRLCREAFRLHPQDFATIDLIILARPGISQLSNKEVTTIITNQLDNLRTDRYKVKP